MGCIFSARFALQSVPDRDKDKGLRKMRLGARCKNKIKGGGKMVKTKFTIQELWKVAYYRFIQSFNPVQWLTRDELEAWCELHEHNILLTKFNK